MVQPASAINVLTQLGFEAVPGDGSPTAYSMQSLTIEPGDEIAVNEFAAQGHRFETIVALNQAWSTLAVSGPALYTEALLAIENIFGTVTPTTVGTATKKRVYDMLLTGSITPRTWSLQFGDASDNVNTLAYGLLTDLGLKYDRKAGVTLDGVAGIAQIIASGGAFTASPATLPNVPILGSHVNYFLDGSGATLGTTQLLDEPLDFSWGVKGLKAARWVSDRAQASFKGHVDVRPKADVKLSMAEDAVTRANLSNLRRGDTLFLRAQAQGQFTENTYSLTISGAPTGGTFTLSYKGQTTAGIAFNATNTVIQTAFLGLSTVGTGNATVTGSGPFIITMTGALAQDASPVTSSGAALTGGTTPAATTVSTAQYYMLTTDVALKVTKIAKFGAKDDIYMREFDCAIVEDPTWGHALMLTSQTLIAAL